MNSMQQQELLVSKGLATKKVNGNLVTYKYAKKVMYDYLWDTDSSLLECRGHTYDINTGEIVLAAPTKSFNYLENGTWADVPLDTPVVAYKKYNGFMASATSYKNQLIVGTTGTTSEITSKYVTWARREIIKSNAPIIDGVTRIFEIVIPEDPHIVKEEVQGAVFLLSRYDDGVTFPKGDYIESTLADILELKKTDRGEGWMVYKLVEDTYIDYLGNCCKIKSDYYVQKKKLMRAGKNTVAEMYANTEKYIQSFNPEFAKVIQCVVSSEHQELWSSAGDQERRKIIEQFLGE
jgi:hypothetical protein